MSAGARGCLLPGRVSAPALTGAQSSSASCAAPSGARHSRASKYNHWSKGTNFPVTAWSERGPIGSMATGVPCAPPQPCCRRSPVGSKCPLVVTKRCWTAVRITTSRTPGPGSPSRSPSVPPVLPRPRRQRPQGTGPPRSHWRRLGSRPRPGDPAAPPGSAPAPAPAQRPPAGSGVRTAPGRVPGVRGCQAAPVAGRGLTAALGRGRRPCSLRKACRAWKAACRLRLRGSSLGPATWILGSASAWRRVTCQQSARAWGSAPLGLGHGTAVPQPGQQHGGAEAGLT